MYYFYGYSTGTYGYDTDDIDENLYSVVTLLLKTYCPVSNPGYVFNNKTSGRIKEVPWYLIMTYLSQ